ncbi:MAG: isoprenylcysteine carboxylmethyltransferase family protein [Alphaproteobacteria bacterium]
MPAKVAFALIAEAFVFGLILFGSAGTLRWPAGWYFLFLFFGAAALITARLARHDPALLDERMKAFNQKGQPLWDQIFLVLVLLGFIAWLVVMGLDARFGWSAVAAPLQLVGAVGVVTGFWIVDRVFRENTFAAPVVKMQAERGQKVISTGPYAVVRHPMYAGAAPLLIGAGLLLVHGGAW